MGPTDDLRWEAIMKSAKVRFGLKAQGHIPTIETMLGQGKSWVEIGKAIGWCPETAKRHWEELQAKGPTQEVRGDR